MTKPLPEFELPPIHEVAIGVQFEALQRFRAGHLGLFWSRIRGRYPLIEDQMPLAAVVEQPTISPQAAQFTQLFMTALPVPRCWFIDQTGNYLIQLQKDRFLRNWRKITGEETYPGYPALVQQFKDEWSGFKQFVEDENLGLLNLNQCELTYTNNLESTGTATPGDVARDILHFCPGKPQGFLPHPEYLSGQSRYMLPEGRGRLYVEVNPAFRATDMKLLVTLGLTARGAPASRADESVFEWFDLAHEWIVRAFDEMTDPAMHRIWKKKHDAQ